MPKTFVCIFFVAMLLHIPLHARANDPLFTSRWSRVDQDIKAFDQAIARMRQPFANTPARPTQIQWVKQKLAHMVKIDQYMRRYTDVPAQRRYSSREMQRFRQQMSERWEKIDAHNTKELKKLLRLHAPWFVISKFGKKASANAWLLVQHADRDHPFQKRILRQLETLHKRGECSAKNYAYLFDRVAVSVDRRPQRYGTQGRCVAKGKWEPLPMEDPSQIDQRRRRVGLGTLKAYKQLFLHICQAPLPNHRKVAKADLQDAFFHLHQAVGHLESWATMRARKQKQCASSLKYARQHFAKIRNAVITRFHHPLLHAGYRLNGAFIATDRIEPAAIEALRMDLHQQARRLGLHHDISWHKEFFACRHPQASVSSRPASHHLPR